jgi:Alpha/beta hydrolase of unknown function (DUF1400)
MRDKSARFSQKFSHCLRSSLVALSVLTTGALWPAAASAAETVVLRYGIFRGSLPTADLAEFAETGNQSDRLKRYLRLADQEPADLQRILNNQISTEPRGFNLLMSSPAGDALLGELSRYIYNSKDDDKAALRTAINSSAEADQQISLIDILQNYPTENVYINVKRAVSTYQQIASIQSKVDGVLGGGLDQILREINRR